MFRRITLIILAALIPAAIFAIDPVTDLQRKIDSGEIKLTFDDDHGYLSSVLKGLNIPVSSQALVFSKSSFQLHLISPATPRALYFNDDVYVGYVQGGPVLEIASIDPKVGPVFYTVNQEKDPRPKFERQTSNCLVCHDSDASGKSPIPRLLMLTMIPDPNGNAIGTAALLTTDQSPMTERWGGWYVTGTHGAQRHLGNTTVKLPASTSMNIPKYIPQMNLNPGANVTDLASRVDLKPYLSPHSDIVALMVLAHQTHVHNLIALASYKTDPKEAGESIVRSMLFVGAAPLTEPVKGTSSFAAEFVKQGPRDSHGRSLRDLDLKTRLLRYPLSYLIYSESFDQMPVAVKQYVYRRLREVLSGEDKSADFAHLFAPDREAILGILQETKPDFAERKTADAH